MFNICRFSILFITITTSSIACRDISEDVTSRSYHITSQTIQQNSQNLINQEDSEVQYQLANNLIQQRKYKEAITWYIKSANQQHTLSQHELGCFYANGLCVPKNINEAIKWYRKAAKNNHIEAQYSLGILYASINDQNQAIKWCKKAAKNNHIEAQHSLDMLYASINNKG